MNHFRNVIVLLLLLAMVTACEKEIEIDVPTGEMEVVIEGRVENGMPPIVFVSRTRGFFEPTSFDDFVELFVDDAEVKVNGIALQRVCTDELSDELLPLFEEVSGIPAGQLGTTTLCGYIGLDAALLGEENTTYRLEVTALGKQLDAVAHIPNVLAPDSVWYRLWANSPNFGFVFANVSDPDTLNNAYRVFTRRILPADPDTPPDGSFFPPLGAAFADDFFNSETIEVGFTRGQPPNSNRPGDIGDEARFFKSGDTFLFKFCSTTRPVYDFFRTFEAQIGANGSPFAAPNNVISNINGGLGVWAAYACEVDTVYAIP